MDILDNLCRSCNINKEKLLNIHDIQESSGSIKSMLEYCMQTTIINESIYPRFICCDCFKQLEISYRFIKRFHLSQSEFEESCKWLRNDFGEANGGRIAENPGRMFYEGELKANSIEVFEDSGQVNCTRNIKLVNSIPMQFENSLESTNMSKCSMVSLDTEKSSEICLHCNKSFFTKKALNLHTKLSHKRKN